MKGKEMMQRDRVDGRIHPAARQKRLRAGGKTQRPALFGPVERFDPEAVAREKEYLLIGVPNGEGEHPVQVSAAVGSPGVPCLEDDLAVALREEAITALFELATQRSVVVDGPVEDQGETQLGIHHRLVRTHRKIDDGQAPMPEPERSVAVAPAVVRTAPRQLAHHGLDGLQIGRGAVESQLTANTAHRTAPVRSGSLVGDPLV